MIRFGLLVMVVGVGCTNVERSGSDEVVAGTDMGGPPTDDEGDDDDFCEHGPLFWGPEPLPNADLDQPYRVDVRQHAEPGWWGVGYTDVDALPAGLAFDPDTVEVYGTPTELGTHTFTVAAYFDVDEDGCSTVPDPHEFTLVVLMAEETAGGSDTRGSGTGGSDTGGSDTGGSDTGGSDTGSTSTGDAR